MISLRPRSYWSESKILANSKRFDGAHHCLGDPNIFYLLPNGGQFTGLAEWRVIPFPPTPGVAPVPRNGAILQWWQLPKDQWPVQAPWEPKVFGAWPASKISIAEDLQKTPPFGFIKLRVPGENDKKGFQIPFNNMKLHTRPDGLEYFNRMKIMSRNTPMGQKFYLMDENWNQHEYEAKQYRAAIRAMKRERIQQMLAEEIVRTKGEPRPSVDLFT